MTVLQALSSLSLSPDASIRLSAMTAMVSLAEKRCQPGSSLEMTVVCRELASSIARAVQFFIDLKVGTRPSLCAS